jgi:hypothetical protein
MVLAKRGLGRGLEALLVEVPVMAETSQHLSAIEQPQDSQNNPSVASDIQAFQDIAENMQTENRLLIKEAEALKGFLDDFETLVQCHGI